MPLIPVNRLSTIAAALRAIESTQIYWREADVSAFVQEVQKNADTEKHALGFWPGQVYEDAAREGRLLIAVDNDAKSSQYVGHLLFSRTFPNARILQLYVHPKYRSRGIARKLVNYLTESLEPHHYLSIRARVADDLPANAAWERLGFAMICQKQGGVTTNRKINVRVKPLRTPTLFGIPESVPDTELRLATNVTTSLPTYAIDLNVFFDVVRRRPRANDAAKVISAGLGSLVRIVVAEEFVAELRRTSTTGSDPVLEFAAELPAISAPPCAVLSRLTAEIRTIAFPHRPHSLPLRGQDQSDLIHLATAIYHTLAGFVTNEKAFLREQHQFYQKYGLRVMDVSKFADAVKSSKEPLKRADTKVSGSALSIGEVSQSEEDRLNKFLVQFPIPAEFRAHFDESQSCTTRKRLIASSGADIICAATWNCLSGLHEIARIRCLTNEDHPALETALDILLDRICREASKKGEVVLSLEFPKGQVTAQALANLKGFAPSANESNSVGTLLKACLGRAVEPEAWPLVTTWLQNVAHLTLDTSLPPFTSETQTIAFESRERRGRVTLDTLETFLGPTLLLLENRSAVIAPIRRSFADDLLGSASQMFLIPSPGAVLSSERVYYSSSKNARLLRSGVPLVFYESGRDHGRACAVAVCRVQETVIASKAAISGQLLRHGVLDESEIEHLTADDKIAVTTFDNLMVFQSPVPLKRLREIGCVNEANLVCPASISAERLRSLIREGQPHA
jgi:ribosomal protein S18 acetylase RimI-like enzyme/predicted nucleic acid-binding protein